MVTSPPALSKTQDETNTGQNGSGGFAEWLADVGAHGVSKRWIRFVAKHRPMVLVRALDTGRFTFETAKFPAEQPKRFEDCAWLFHCNPTNRGVLRMDLDEAAQLFKLASARPRPRVLEIGRLVGGSTVLLAIAGGEGARVTSIDIAPKDDASLRRALERLGVSDRVELVVADANTIKPDPEGYDLLFIDGDHSYEGVKKDYDHWCASLKPSGAMVFHDAVANRPNSTDIADVGRLIAEIEKSDSARFRRIPGAGSLAVFVRN